MGLIVSVESSEIRSMKSTAVSKKLIGNWQGLTRLFPGTKESPTVGLNPAVNTHTQAEADFMCEKWLASQGFLSDRVVSYSFFSLIGQRCLCGV